MLTPALTGLERFPEYRRPMSVDKQFRDARSGGLLGLDAMSPRDPTVPVAFGLKARGHFGVLEYHRGDFSLAGYARGPWELLKTETRQFLLRASVPINTNAVRQRNITDEDNSVATFNLNGGGIVFISSGFDLNDCQVRYGTSALAVDGAHFNLQGTKFGPMVASVSEDDVNFRSNASGSRVHTEAGNTIREIAIFQKYINTAGSARRVMVDRSVIADTAIAQNQTASVSYQFQF